MRREYDFLIWSQVGSKEVQSAFMLLGLTSLALIAGTTKTKHSSVFCVTLPMTPLPSQEGYLAPVYAAVPTGKPGFKPSYLYSHHPKGKVTLLHYTVLHSTLL